MAALGHHTIEELARFDEKRHAKVDAPS